jgi:hypothetical protein
LFRTFCFLFSKSLAISGSLLRVLSSPPSVTSTPGSVHINGRSRGADLMVRKSWTSIINSVKKSFTELVSDRVWPGRLADISGNYLNPVAYVRRAVARTRGRVLINGILYRLIHTVFKRYQLFLYQLIRAGEYGKYTCRSSLKFHDCHFWGKSRLV